MRLRRDIDADEVPRPLPKPPAPSDCSDGSDIDDILMGTYISSRKKYILQQWLCFVFRIQAPNDYVGGQNVSLPD